MMDIRRKVDFTYNLMDYYKHTQYLELCKYHKQQQPHNHNKNNHENKTNNQIHYTLYHINHRPG